jgi:cupin fold WbuC family metalloprotein
MNDLTRIPEENTLQTLLNTWTDGSYSPVHKHFEYAETFVALSGALAFFTFAENGTASCHVLHDGNSGGSVRAIVIEKNEWHAMTAAPKALGYPGFAIVFETSGHVYNNSTATKVLAPFAPHDAEGNDGDKIFFQQILATCPPAATPSSGHFVA